MRLIIVNISANTFAAFVNFWNSALFSFISVTSFSLSYMDGQLRLSVVTVVNLCSE